MDLNSAVRRLRHTCLVPFIPVFFRFRGGRRLNTDGLRSYFAFGLHRSTLSYQQQKKILVNGLITTAPILSSCEKSNNLNVLCVLLTFDKEHACLLLLTPLATTG